MQGFSFTASPNARGDSVTLVASKDDHESKQTVVMTLSPEQALELRDLLDGVCQSAKRRRKAIRKAADSSAVESK